MGRLEGQVAIVTGASRGIGKAVALEFGRQGAKVAIVSRSELPPKSGLPGTIGETVDEIKKNGGQAIAIKTNVMEEAEVSAMVKQVLNKWGRIDILVNNAAAAGPGTFLEMTSKRWNLVIGVNLLGTFLCCKAVAPVMVKLGGGAIVNTSSGAARKNTSSASALGIAYGTAKAAIEHFTRALACELGEYNIAVNCYDPAKAVASEGFVFNLPKDYDKSRFVGPENMVRACLFLAQQRVKGGVTGSICQDEEYIEMYHLPKLS